MSDKETINMMFQAFLQIQNMEVPYAIKNKMLQMAGCRHNLYRFKDY